MKHLNSVLLTLSILVIFAGIGWIDHHKGTTGLSISQREQLGELRVELREINPGDLITYQHPRQLREVDGNIIYHDEPETYLIVKKESFCKFRLSGPGPQSRRGRGHNINWCGNVLLSDLIKKGIFVHRNGEPGHKQLASWYYLQ